LKNTYLSISGLIAAAQFVKEYPDFKENIFITSSIYNASIKVKTIKYIAC